MKNKWNLYPQNRKMCNYNDYIVIVPLSFDESQAEMSLFCDVCGIIFESSEDEKVYKRFGCCSSCADMWAYSNSEKWKSGWRPSSDQIKTVLNKRSFIDPNIIFE